MSISPSGEFSPLATRNPIFNAERGLTYPSPFFDVSSTYIPRTIRSLYRWCKFYYDTNPLAHAIISKLATYPLTDIMLESEDDNERKWWENLLLEKMQYKSFEVGMWTDRYVYGASYANILFPFRKTIICNHCKHQVDALSERHSWRYSGERFTLDCPKCHHKGRATTEDVYSLSEDGIRLVRRNPVDIEVKYHEQDGTSEYLYFPTSDLRADIVAGRKRVVATTPNELLEAIRVGRPVRLNPQNLIQLKRFSASGREQGVGTPVLLPVFKSMFYMQVLKKAQEAIALNFIIPWRFLFPQAGGPLQDPTTTVDLTQWKDQVEKEIKKFRYDPGHVSVLAFPMGHQLIGGEGRALLLSQELRVEADQIIIGMGYPPGLLYGDTGWSGASINLRLLENMFMRDMEDRKLLLRFVMRNIGLYLGRTPIGFHTKAFKMADDVQRKQLAVNLNQAGKISDATLRSECDYDSEKEDDLIAQESKEGVQRIGDRLKDNARMQGEASVIQAEFQAKAQAAMQRTQQSFMSSAELPVPGAIGGPQSIEAPGQSNLFTGALTGIDARIIPRKLAEQIQSLPPDQKKMALDQMRMTHPETYAAVAQHLFGTPTAQPLPAQLPPRAGPSTAQV